MSLIERELAQDRLAELHDTDNSPTATAYNEAIDDALIAIAAVPDADDSLNAAVRSPRFRAAVDAVFAAPGEFGPAKGYYGADTGHFIDMLAAKLGKGEG